MREVFDLLVDGEKVLVRIEAMILIEVGRWGIMMVNEGENAH